MKGWMKTRKGLLLTGALGCLAGISGCLHPDTGQKGTDTGQNGTDTLQKEMAFTDSVVMDPFYNALFSGDCDGFTGGDGTYSVALPDGRTIWLFGDSFIGGLNPDGTREKQVPMYIRNCAIVQDGREMHTLLQERNGVNASFAIPPTPPGSKPVPEDSIWFWPGDGLVEGGQFKLFLSEFIKTDTGMWGFEWRGTWIGSYTLPGLKEEKTEPLPFLSHLEIHFGHAVCETREHTYVYGLGYGKPCAARYPAGDIHGTWEFYDGAGWSGDPGEARPMADIDGSEQFSVFRSGQTYVLVTQRGWFSDEICSYTSETPYGPWGNRQLLYRTPLPDSAHHLITYNALAHPQFTESGMLLISYNTNSRILEDHFRDASIYRPRFIRVPMKDILGKDPQEQHQP
jgi:hypothetical protein